MKEITFVSAVLNSSSIGNLGERPEHNAWNGVDTPYSKETYIRKKKKERKNAREKLVSSNSMKA